mmetsp:Transcript_25710/g.67454  ORF Transcript_25710/g.67454 Transcript_25710/m.67454 type:complete len:308 (-) Transcript_25710:630-1553(-)
MCRGITVRGPAGGTNSVYKRTTSSELLRRGGAPHQIGHPQLGRPARPHRDVGDRDLAPGLPHRLHQVNRLAAPVLGVPDLHRPAAVRAVGVLLLQPGQSVPVGLAARAAGAQLKQVMRVRAPPLAVVRGVRQRAHVVLQLVHVLPEVALSRRRGQLPQCGAARRAVHPRLTTLGVPPGPGSPLGHLGKPRRPQPSHQGIVLGLARRHEQQRPPVGAVRRPGGRAPRKRQHATRPAEVEQRHHRTVRCCRKQLAEAPLELRGVQKAPRPTAPRRGGKLCRDGRQKLVGPRFGLRRVRHVRKPLVLQRV